jgi:hypothetical protein
LENRTVPAEIFLDGETYCDGRIMLPPLEDAHAIQMVLRHVMQLMLQRRIERKDAGLMLYALQIASGNLKQMEAEKPRPTQVVREVEKVAETPMGMTPWSARGEGYDVDGDEEQEEQAPPMTAEEMYYTMTADERVAWGAKLRGKGLINAKEYEDYFENGGADPYLLATIRMCAARERKEKAITEAAQGLGGGGGSEENAAGSGA